MVSGIFGAPCFAQLCGLIDMFCREIVSIVDDPNVSIAIRVCKRTIACLVQQTQCIIALSVYLKLDPPLVASVDPITDCAKIGVLICYDVEFPELSRIMADQGMQILFVPFLTDTQNGYSRVRVCAQARAIENECFVVIAGSVGNLPRVHNMDIQYAQSGVFTPCDFAFPTDGKRAEATPNTEMILVSDVDLNLLNELHTYGSVRNLKDRRNDLYELKVKKPRE